MDQKLNLGIVCYPTYGGSGVIASEIGMAMARRGHRVHFICADLPRRLDRFMENIFFHEVEMRDYPVFVSPPYAIGLASKIVEVSTYENLDILHVHYAVPHATSAFLAKQVLGTTNMKVITTLHGTDITLVGNDRSYLPITRFSILKSEGVTAPSLSLKHATYDKLNVSTRFPIEVIPNFVDVNVFKPAEGKKKRIPGCDPKEIGCRGVIVHTSNFRPVKRIQDVIQVFKRVNEQTPAHLLLIGDGPERSTAESLVRELKLADRVCFLGKLESFVEVLQQSDVFLLPSEHESFGLAALEAMSCGVPVVASKAGGIPEVIVSGECGFLSEVGDVDSMAADVVRILRDKELAQRLSKNARTRVEENFHHELMADRYEEYYRRILNQSSEPSA